MLLPGIITGADVGIEDINGNHLQPYLKREAFFQPSFVCSKAKKVKGTTTAKNVSHCVFFI